MKILVVDDIPTNVILLVELLVEKHDVLTANNGYDAVKIVAEERPDIVLLDILMPEIDGFQVLEKIKTDERVKKTVVIMLTAKTEKADVQRALMIGADDYIKKPIDATELLTKINIQKGLIEKRRKVEEYEVYAKINESMVMAQRLQQSLLPDQKSFARIFPRAFKLFIPRDFVSGDFYFALQSGSKKILIVYDCIGHGVPASMFSVLVYMELHRIIYHNGITNPKDIATILHAEIMYHLSKSADTYSMTNGMDIAICEFDTETRILNFAGAYMPLVIIRPGDSELIVDDKSIRSNMELLNFNLFMLKGDKQSMNIHSNGEYSMKSMQLKHHDNVYLFTDGFTDQFGGEENKKFTRRRLFQMLLKNQNIPLRDQKLVFYHQFNDWMAHTQQTDDALMVGISI